MQQLRLTLVSVLIAVATAACAGSASTPSTPPSVAAPSSSQPTTTPTTVPIASPTMSAAASSASPAGAPTISLYEWKVIVASTIKSGKATYTISNFGAIPHELLIFKSDLAPAAYPQDKTGHIIEDGPGIKLVSDGANIDPTGAQVRTIDLKPGTYLFVCNIPGHFKQGMFTVVTVSP